MKNDPTQLSFEEVQPKADNGPVVCLGMTFKNDEERREYFREELRKKLPELRKIEGFPIGDDEDIIALSDPPYYTACPNPWINDFIEEWEESKEKNENIYHRDPYSTDVLEEKSDPLYNAHSYHTKVPHKAIMRYILHYTEPGDIIYDGFGGTGMTGVAAQLCGDIDEVRSLGYEVDDEGIIYRIDNNEKVAFSKIGRRKAIIGDLSPIASFISYNYNIPMDVDSLLNKSERTLKKIDEKYGWIYKTCTSENPHELEEIFNEIKNYKSFSEISNFIQKKEKQFGTINYIVLSDSFNCPECTTEFIYWDVAIDKEELKLKDDFDCPSCGKTLTKKDLEHVWINYFDEYTGTSVKTIKREPVLINYIKDNKRFYKRPDKIDRFLINTINNIRIQKWFPIEKIPEGDKTNEAIKLGMEYSHQFYSKRNLFLLSELWDESKKNRILRMALTAILVKTGSLLHNIGLKNGKINLAGALPNAIYIPSNLAERNIIELVRSKLEDFKRASLERIKDNNVVSCMSFGLNDLVVNNNRECLDYIFIDPPFGANLMYSELNFLWESWLNVKTNNEPEAIVNKTQKKNLNDYHKLMYLAFRQAYDHLKPGRWMTVEFSNTKASVWNVIQTAIQEAGFVIANVSALNKGQGTYNSQTNPTSVKQDLVISAYKPTKNMEDVIKQNKGKEESTWSFIKQHLKNIPIFSGRKGKAEIIIERTPRVLFDRMVAYHVQNGIPVPISSAEFQAGIAQKFPMRDGMVFLENQVAEYDKKRTIIKDFIQQNLFVSDENSAIEWLRQGLMSKPQTRQDIQPNFMKQIQHIAKHEELPELDELLEQNFLRYDGDGPVPDQIISYLRRNYKDLRGLEPDDSKVIEKAMHRWYVPDPNKQADLERLREKALLREFEGYLTELEGNRKKLRNFRTEAVRAGFKKAYSEKDFETIVKVGERIPEKILQEDDKLLMYYDNACIRLGL